MIAEISLLGTAAFVLIPVIIAAWYTFYSHDDFTNVKSAGALGTNVIVSDLYVYFFDDSDITLKWIGSYAASGRDDLKYSPV